MGFRRVVRHLDGRSLLIVSKPGCPVADGLCLGVRSCSCMYTDIHYVCDTL